MTDQEREVNIRAIVSAWYEYSDSKEPLVVLLRLLDTERGRVNKLTDALSDIAHKGQYCGSNGAHYARQALAALTTEAK